jgi:NAD(P)H-quinone oxidoreductase subunit I
MLKNIKYTLLSMFVVFKHLFRKPVTLEYPEHKIEPNNIFRGKPSVQGCIKCQTCIKVCPTGAINISQTELSFDLNKCIFCGNCSYYCPTKALKLTKNYELATTDKSELKLSYDITEGGNNERNM